MQRIKIGLLISMHICIFILIYYFYFDPKGRFHSFDRLFITTLISFRNLWIFGKCVVAANGKNRLTLSFKVIINILCSVQLFRYYLTSLFQQSTALWNLNVELRSDKFDSNIRYQYRNIIQTHIQISEAWLLTSYLIVHGENWK